MQTLIGFALAPLRAVDRRLAAATVHPGRMPAAWVQQQVEQASREAR